MSSVIAPFTGVPTQNYTEGELSNDNDYMSFLKATITDFGPLLFCVFTHKYGPQLNYNTLLRPFSCLWAIISNRAVDAFSPSDLNPYSSLNVNKGVNQTCSRFVSKTLDTGSRYTGEFLNGKFHGDGELEDNRGNFFKGQFKNGEPVTGQGALLIGKTVFKGKMENGEFVGNCRLDFLSGGFYKGGILDKKKSGEGSIHYSDGASYKGHFLADKYHGQGVYIDKDGNRFDGQFNDHKPYNGKGTYSHSEWKYTGEMREGQKVGEGSIYYADGASYKGHFLEDSYNGQGVYKDKDGNIFEGEFRDNKPHNGKGTYSYSEWKYTGEIREGQKIGEGTILYSNGSTYQGGFLADKPHGVGLYRKSDGKRYKGDFQEGRFHGQGDLLFPDGARYEGEFKKGELDGKGIYQNSKTPTYIYGHFKKGMLLAPIIDVSSEQEFCLSVKGACFAILSVAIMITLIIKFVINHIRNEERANANQRVLRARDQIRRELNSEIINPEGAPVFSKDEKVLIDEFDTKFSERIPDCFRCPISSELLLNPVTLLDSGHSYERQHLEEWINENSKDRKRAAEGSGRAYNGMITDPFSNAECAPRYCQNHHLRKALRLYYDTVIEPTMQKDRDIIFMQSVFRTILVQSALREKLQKKHSNRKQ